MSGDNDEVWLCVLVAEFEPDEPWLNPPDPIIAVAKEGSKLDCDAQAVLLRAMPPESIEIVGKGALKSIKILVVNSAILGDDWRDSLDPGKLPN